MRGRLLAVLLLAAAIAAPRAGAAEASGARAGIPAAAGEADLRAPGASLVEIEGFTDPQGRIPCGRRSFSNSWHYKFYDGADWMLVNACAGNAINAAKHIPYDKTGEPAMTLPASFSDSPEILEGLKKAGFFLAPPSPYERDILMKVSRLPAKADRPEGCYWTVSRGKERVVTDCAGERRWTEAKPGSGKTAAPAKTDSAGKYRDLAIATVRRKHPRAVLMAVESLVDKKGGAKCVTAGSTDGWVFVFRLPDAGTNAVFSACRGKTFLEEADFTGKTGYVRDYVPMPDQFKDSSEAILKLPAACSSRSTILLRLHKYKPGMSPVKSYPFLWTADCGAARFYVDAATGRYLGEGVK